MFIFINKILPDIFVYILEFTKADKKRGVWYYLQRRYLGAIILSMVLLFAA